MSLFRFPPQEIPLDPSRHETVSFVSRADGQHQSAEVYSPSSSRYDYPLPLVLSPHAFGWTAAENYHGGPEGLKIGYHPGWYGLPEKYGVIVVIPHGHHRREELRSLANPPQIQDLADLIDIVETHNHRVERSRVYACGVSMGAQEALVLAGRHADRLAAVAEFNPVVDLAALHEDLATASDAELRDAQMEHLVANEVGGLPGEVPVAYAERSPISYVDALAHVPTMLYWTHKDLLIPRQETHHSYRLYRMVKQLAATNPMAEYNHTASHAVTTYTPEICWQLHEWCDYELALRWLLNHRRR